MTCTPVESKPGLRHTALASVRNYVGALSLSFKLETCTLKPLIESPMPYKRPVATGPEDPGLLLPLTRRFIFNILKNQKNQLDPHDAKAQLRYLICEKNKMEVDF